MKCHYLFLFCIFFNLLVGKPDDQIGFLTGAFYQSPKSTSQQPYSHTNRANNIKNLVDAGCRSGRSAPINPQPFDHTQCAKWSASLYWGSFITHFAQSAHYPGVEFCPNVGPGNIYLCSVGIDWIMSQIDLYQYPHFCEAIKFLPNYEQRLSNVHSMVHRRPITSNSKRSIANIDALYQPIQQKNIRLEKARQEKLEQERQQQIQADAQAKLALERQNSESLAYLKEREFAIAESKTQPRADSTDSSGDQNIEQSLQQENSTEQIIITDTNNQLVKTIQLISTVQFTPTAHIMLKSIGLERAFDTSLVVNPTKEQISLFSWIKKIVNTAANIYGNTTDFCVKAAIAETAMLCGVAHDLAVKGQVRRAADLIQLGYAAVCKYEEYQNIARQAAFDRGVQIVCKPHVFVYEQVKGIGQGLLALGKAADYCDKLSYDFATQLEFLDFIQTIPEHMDAVSQTISHMSADDWDQAMKNGAQALGHTSVDTVASLALFHVAPKVLSSAAIICKNALPAKDVTRFIATPQRLANAIELVFDEAAQAFVMQEQLVPALVGAGETAPALPALVTAADSVGAVGNVARAESLVAANAPKVVEQAVVTGETISESVLSESALLNERRKLVVTLDAVNQQMIAKELLVTAIEVSPCRELFLKYDSLVTVAEKYGFANAEEAIRLLNLKHEGKFAKLVKPFEVTENLAKDLQKINSNSRWEKFKYDAAKGGAVSLSSIEEALAGIACEEQGLLKTLVRSKGNAEEFIENLPGGVKHFWDVKTFKSNALNGKYIFDKESAIKALVKGYLCAEDVILNITYLTEQDVDTLFKAIAKQFGEKEIRRTIVIHTSNPAKSTIDFLQLLRAL